MHANEAPSPHPLGSLSTLDNLRGINCKLLFIEVEEFRVYYSFKYFNLPVIVEYILLINSLFVVSLCYCRVYSTQIRPICSAFNCFCLSACPFSTICTWIKHFARYFRVIEVKTVQSEIFCLPGEGERERGGSSRGKYGQAAVDKSFWANGRTSSGTNGLPNLSIQSQIYVKHYVNCVGASCQQESGKRAGERRGGVS